MNWYDEVNSYFEKRLKANWEPLCKLTEDVPAVAQAFQEMPAEDRVFLSAEGRWEKCGELIWEGRIYRLREDWERPDEKSELVELMEKWEVSLKRITEPLDLIGSRLVREAMEQALEAGLCEYFRGGWYGADGKTHLAIRLAPDWRTRLDQPNNTTRSLARELLQKTGMYEEDGSLKKQFR